MTFQSLFKGQSTEVRAIGKRLREIVFEVMPKAEERPFKNIILYGETGEVCGIQPAADRCNFYLTHGAHLDDPDGLLEGKGKGIRHVKVRDPIPEKALKRLIRADRKYLRSIEA